MTVEPWSDSLHNISSLVNQRRLSIINVNAVFGVRCSLFAVRATIVRNSKFENRLVVVLVLHLSE